MLERSVLIDWRGSLRNGKKDFANFISGRLLLSKIFKEPKIKIQRKQILRLKIWWNWTESSNEETVVTEKYLQRCSTSLAISMQIKTALRLHPTLVIMAKTKETTAKADTKIIRRKSLFSHCFNITREESPVIENEVQTAWKISKTSVWNLTSFSYCGSHDFPVGRLCKPEALSHHLASNRSFD